MVDPLSQIPLEHLAVAAALLPLPGPASPPESVDIDSLTLGRIRVRFVPVLHGDLEDSWRGWRAESARRLGAALLPAHEVRYVRVGAGAGSGEMEPMLVE